MLYVRALIVRAAVDFLQQYDARRTRLVTTVRLLEVLDYCRVLLCRVGGYTKSSSGLRKS